ncbi:MAG: hypothetical protein P8K80_04785 [Phycisphaerales bacterium]|nr:hypothetical protein [Phycisphaerales bacterium]
MQPEFTFQPLLLWLLALDLFLLAALVMIRPGSLLRPSVFFTAIMCVTVNIAAATVQKEIYEPVTTLSAIRLSVLLFPLCVIAWVLATPHLTTEASNVARRCRSVAWDPIVLGRDERRSIILLAALTILALAGYLLTVGLANTGLWSILFDPGVSAEARERSLKTIDVPLIGYLYVFFRTAVAPALFVLCVFSISRRRPVLATALGILALLCLIGVGLEGARMPIGWIILALAFAYMLIKGIWRGALVVGLGALLVLGMVFTISIARIGMINELDGRVFETYSTSVLDRAFVSPFDTGVLANRYAEDVGGLGVSSIRPLALAMGEEPVNLPNTVNRTYFPHLRETGMVNTSFIFDLQASFGIWEGWWISLVLLGILDHLLYLFRGGRGLLLVAFFAALMTSMISLVNSAFTTVLLSGGIMWIPLLFLACRLRPLDLEDSSGLQVEG